MTVAQFRLFAAGLVAVTKSMGVGFTAGSGVDAAQYTGGRALQKENDQDKPRKRKKKRKRQRGARDPAALADWIAKGSQG